MIRLLVNKLSLYAPAVLSGIALIFCFPTFDLYLLSWIALVPFLISLWNKKPEQAFKAGFFMGLPYFFGTLYWIYHSINHYGGVSFISSLCIVFLLCLYLSLYTGLFALFFSIKIRSTRFPALFIAPVLWVTLEFIRSYALTGFPWSSIGYTQYRFLHAIQFADITGIYGVSFFVVAVNGAIADFFIMKRRLQDMPLFSLSQTAVGFVLLSVSIIAIFIYGYWHLHENRPGKPIRVSIIQGNIEQDKKWETAYQKEVLDTFKELSKTAVTRAPSLIVWPETSVPFYFNYDKAYIREFTDFQRELNAYLLFGSILIKEAPPEGSRYLLANSAILLDPDGKTSYIYDKIHLVPFGEYIPLRKILFFLDKLVVGIGDYVPGKHYLRAETPYGSFGTHICYEIIFPGLVRKFYSRGGDFMVTITNDAWFGRTTGPYQHFSMAVFRAIENRKPLIRAANTGVSGFIDSNGRILGTMPIFQKEVMTMDVMTDSYRSFYSKYGDLFSYLCIIITVLLLMSVSRR